MWFCVSRMAADSAGPSEKNRPPIDHEESTPRAASRNGLRTTGGTLGRCGVSRARDRSATGSGISSAPVNAIANSANRITYGTTRGAGSSCTSGRRDQHPEPDPAGARDAVGQADAGRVLPRVKVEQRGAGRCERQAGGEALQPAGHEQPDDRLGEHVEDGRHEQRAERGEQHRPAADLVGQATGEHERREDAECVRGVDQRQDGRREAPELAVGPIQRGRSDRREQRQSDD